MMMAAVASLYIYIGFSRLEVSLLVQNEDIVNSGAEECKVKFIKFA